MKQRHDDENNYDKQENYRPPQGIRHDVERKVVKCFEVAVLRWDRHGRVCFLRRGLHKIPDLLEPNENDKGEHQDRRNRGAPIK